MNRVYFQQINMPNILQLFLLFLTPALSLHQLAQSFNKGCTSVFILPSNNGSILIQALSNKTIFVNKLNNGTYDTIQKMDFISPPIDGSFLGDDNILVITFTPKVCYFQWNVSIQEYVLKLEDPTSWILYTKFIPSTNIVLYGGIFSVNYLIAYKFVDIYTLPTLYYDFSSLGSIGGMITQYDFSESSTIMICAGNEKIIRVFEHTGSGFILLDSFPVVNDNQYIKCSDECTKITVVGSLTTEIYFWSGTQYNLSEIRTNQFSVICSSILPDYRMAYAGSSNIIILNQITSNGSFFEIQKMTAPSTTAITQISMDQTSAVIYVSGETFSHIFHDCLLPNCKFCIGILQCGSCQIGYALNSAGGCTIQPSQNILQNNTMCDKSCIKCQGLQCLSCPILSSQSQKDPLVCQVSEQDFSIMAVVVAILQIVRHYKIKSVLFIANDIWLYEYHKNDYYGTVNIIFQGVRQMQDEKSRLIPYEQLEFVQKMKKWLQSYESYSNQKYKAIEAKADLIPSNILNYVLQSIPLSFLFFFITTLLFKLTFNYPISSIFRPFSFWGFLIISLFQNNIDFFVFLGFRNFKHLISKGFFDKISSSVTLVFLFFLLLYALTGYFFLKEHYGKLFKYFLTNMYRIKGSSQAMAIIFCIRPFLQGVIHSLLFNFNTLQLTLLGITNLITFLFISWLQVTFQIMKSRISFSFLQIYFMIGISLNYLLYLNQHLDKDGQAFIIIDQFLEALLVIRLFSLILSSISEIIWGIKCKNEEKKEDLLEEDKRKKEQEQNKENQTQFILVEKITTINNESNQKERIRTIFQNENGQ